MRWALWMVAAALAAWSQGPASAEPARVAADVEMVEFAFRPRTIVLRAGVPVRIVLRNRGQIAHQLEADYLRGVGVEIAGEGLYVDAPGLGVVRLNPGGAARLDFLPRRRGRFSFACTIEGHREAGMTGVLEVR
jgi:uncharacterized cupredoxin-like copper-binding protein